MKHVYLLLISVWICNIAMAHFPMLLTESPFIKEGDKVQFHFSVGHPYERDYENAGHPAALNAIHARGNKESFLQSLQKNSIKYDGKDITTWDAVYQSQTKGSVVIALDTKPSISRNGEKLYQEYIKTVLFVERSSGWDQRTGQPLEIVPLTRPFGFQKGFAFKGRLMAGENPLADKTMYIERFLETPPKPEDIPKEPFVTFEVKTDKEGYFTATLPESGWWIIASYVDDVGEIKHENKTYKHDAMAGIWIHVE